MDNISLDIAFAYPVTYRKTRARNPRTILVGDTLTVRIPNLSAADAPIGLRVVETGKNNHDEDWRSVTERRVIDGSGYGLAEQFGTAYDVEKSRRLFSSHGGTHALLKERWNWNAFAAQIEPWHCPEAKEFHEAIPLDAETIISERRDAMAAIVKRTADQLVFVDGELWWPLPEPMVEVSLPRDNPTGPISIRLNRGRSGYAYEHGFLFVPENAEVARDFTRTWAYVGKDHYNQRLEGLEGRRRVNWDLMNVEVELRDTAVMGPRREAGMNARAGAYRCLNIISGMLASIEPDKFHFIEALARIKADGLSGDPLTANRLLTILDAMSETDGLVPGVHYMKTKLLEAIPTIRDGVSRSCDMPHPDAFPAPDQDEVLADLPM